MVFIRQSYSIVGIPKLLHLLPYDRLFSTPPIRIHRESTKHASVVLPKTHFTGVVYRGLVINHRKRREEPYSRAGAAARHIRLETWLSSPAYASTLFCFIVVEKSVVWPLGSAAKTISPRPIIDWLEVLLNS